MQLLFMSSAQWQACWATWVLTVPHQQMAHKKLKGLGERERRVLLCGGREMRSIMVWAARDLRHSCSARCWTRQELWPHSIAAHQSKLVGVAHGSACVAAGALCSKGQPSFQWPHAALQHSQLGFPPPYDRRCRYFPRFTLGTTLRWRGCPRRRATSAGGQPH